LASTTLVILLQKGNDESKSVGSSNLDEYADYCTDYYADEKNALDGRIAFYFQRQSITSLSEGARARVTRIFVENFALEKVTSQGSCGL